MLHRLFESRQLKSKQGTDEQSGARRTAFINLIRLSTDTIQELTDYPEHNLQEINTSKFIAFTHNLYFRAYKQSTYTLNSEGVFCLSKYCLNKAGKKETRLCYSMGFFI